MTLDSIKVLLPLIVAFVAGIAITPLISDMLYRHKMWKKKAGNASSTVSKGGTPIFNKLHEKRDTGTPRMGGLVIVFAVMATTLLFSLLAMIFPQTVMSKLTFLSRNQTWIPLVTLLLGGVLGFVDDWLTVTPTAKIWPGGLPWKVRMGFVGLLGLAIGSWFYLKLDMTTVFMPFVGDIEMGWLFLPFFMFVMVSVFSTGIIDGIDGLSGGVFSTIFAAYAGIAYFQGQIDIAALCAVIVGGIMAFLWFNIPPARFYMTETGILGLTVTLVVVAFLTDQVLVLPIIAFPLVATVASVIIQIASKKLRNGKKVFLAAPLHHHFEALGWPDYKVSMRYWIVSVFCSIAGLIIALAGRV